MKTSYPNQPNNNISGQEDSSDRLAASLALIRIPDEQQTERVASLTQSAQLTHLNYNITSNLSAANEYSLYIPSDNFEEEPNIESGYVTPRAHSPLLNPPMLIRSRAPVVSEDSEGESDGEFYDGVNLEADLDAAANFVPLQTQSVDQETSSNEEMSLEGEDSDISYLSDFDGN
ncbi:MAG: hypothetical protein SFT91_05835 [Rickettsiaceae bacterium]|nr:hypothetical protein [Rickettsiaceae bacterium]